MVYIFSDELIDMIIETDRLSLREMRQPDYPALCKILQDADVMYVYEGDCAFEELNAGEVFSIIRDTNIASQKVAIRNVMTKKDTFVKHYRGIDMPHYLFSVKRS